MRCHTRAMVSRASLRGRILLRNRSAWGSMSHLVAAIRRIPIMGGLFRASRYQVFGFGSGGRFGKQRASLKRSRLGDCCPPGPRQAPRRPFRSSRTRDLKRPRLARARLIHLNTTQPARPGPSPRNPASAEMAAGSRRATPMLRKALKLALFKATRRFLRRSTWMRARMS